MLGRRRGKMGKVDEKKQQKQEALFQSAYDLFLNQGITKTSIHDIVQRAGVAKGTFYLYFKDKYHIRDKLIAKSASRLFQNAYQALLSQDISLFEDRVIFIVDHVLEELGKNLPMLKFISKNLSWGIFRQALSKSDDELYWNADSFTKRLLPADSKIKIREPDIMVFLIIELAGSTAFSTILENDPVSFAELKPYLYDSIRSIIRNHTTADASEF